MPSLYGKSYTRAELIRHFGCSSQVFGVRLVEFADGLERGVRALQFRTGSGFAFDILVDRCFDPGTVEYRGAALGFHSPTGFRSPALHEVDAEGGLGFLRSFSGFLNTCGLDHVMGPASESADHYNYPYRKTIQHNLHGRISYVPARLIGYGERWDGDECTLWAEGEVVQAAMFGENLHLTRRVEAPVGGTSFTIIDRVENRGFYPTPHMILYHVDIGWPALAAGGRLRAPITKTVYTAHDAKAATIGYRDQHGPQRRFMEQVYEHAMASEPDGTVPVALINPSFGWGGGAADGFGVLMEYNRNQLPGFFQWQNLQEGNYVTGIEPATYHAGTREQQKSRGDLIMLEHGQGRDYRLRFTALAGQAAIGAAEKRIDAIHKQTDPVGGIAVA